MKPRFAQNQIDPEAYKAMLGLETYVQKCGIDKKLHELIKIRASQINGCSYCLDMHTRDARKAGETEQRIYVLPAWRETNFFTQEEQAVLALTEEITNIQGHVSDATYDNAVAVLGETMVQKVLIAALTINAWNRLAITNHFLPDLQK
ncbi:carboxymuconolactone decarboxylase family protein [uncultured Mucilaginibacter sp.]|uniref:carboxymuconolactone decarboxylase family protein n=1 Tax=uncultured Mucilaginibacter sp. TaxID=797541 RepID=UPI0025D97654|nr:carboxymuconolactone decarboxylase family protein [uncultured Mucilaginibacter sp.]